MPFKSYKEGSKANWGCEQDEPLSKEQITLGAVLRIADAVEAMAHNFRDLINENERLETSEKKAWQRVQKEKRRSASYRGIIAKLKRERGGK